MPNGQPDGRGRLDYQGTQSGSGSSKRLDFSIDIQASNQQLEGYIAINDAPTVTKVGALEKWLLREKYIHGDRIPE
jgi:hypothetical protein